MGRKTVLVIIALLFSSAAMADPPGLTPHMLPPGKPAGVRPAQDRATGAIAIGALALIAIGGYAISSHPYRLPGASAATSTRP